MELEHECAFEALLLELAELYDRPAPSKATCALWWQLLAAYPWAVVERALLGHATRCKFFPRPADVVEQIALADGRPGAAEAWAVAQQATDEGATVVWSCEIAAAWDLARPILESGDRIGARLCFVATYERLTDAARATLTPAIWTVSLGHDPDRRYAALRQAVAMGRLGRDQAQALLGPPTGRDGRGAPAERAAGAQPIAGLLAANVVDFPARPADDARRFIAAVRAGIEQAAQRGAGAEAAPPPTPAARRQAAEAHRRAELERLAQLAGGPRAGPATAHPPGGQARSATGAPP